MIVFGALSRIKIGWTRPEATSIWDKAALVKANANSKDLNAIFCGVSHDEFHKSLMLQLPTRRDKSWRRPMKAPKR